jgi:Tfp pilus assembly protein PilF
LASQLKVLFLFWFQPRQAASLAFESGNLWLAVAMACGSSLLWSRSLLGAGLVGGVLVTASILILSFWENLGQPQRVLYRDFMPVLTGVFLAYTAVELPLGWIPGPVGFLRILPFLAFAAFVLRTTLGVDYWKALVTVVLCVPLMFGAMALFFSARHIFFWLASPWILYYVFMLLGTDITRGAQAFRARQNFQRMLQAATVNPNDADSQYQLGLIYVQRRNDPEAESRFREALRIDAQDADYHFHLGRLLVRRSAWDEALDHLHQSARLNPQTSSYEVWREIGMVELNRNQPELARAALEYYVHHREYDPEGLYHYGVSLKRLARMDEAQAAFRKAVEAARTAPAYRRHEVRAWEKKAAAEIV